MTVNHVIRSGYDLDLAMIEGTEVMAFCGLTFTPKLTVGSSGRADVPGAPTCETCERALGIAERWSRLKDEMRNLEEAHRDLMRSAREHRTEVPA